MSTASASSVMNRVKMFESSTSPSDNGRVSPSPEQRREMPIYVRKSPASESPNWQQKLTTADRKAYSPLVRGKGKGADLFVDANSGVGWPSSPAASSTKSGNLLPSQIKSQSKTSPSPVQNGVLGSRHSRSADKPSPVYVNRRSPQPESVDGKKQNASAVRWPSPQTRSANEKVPVKSDPAASFSQDENEAPKGSSLAESRAASRRREAIGSDAASTTGTMSSTGSLSRNLKDASVVIQDERESVASGSTSARSSLSVDELSSIAFRALKASREEEKKKQQQPPDAITTKNDVTTTKKPAKSPRRRRQIQRMSRQHAVRAKATNKPKPANEEKEAVTAKTKASTRISVVSSATSGSTEEQAAAHVSVVSHDKQAVPDKKSRNQLFETARHRNTRSASPLTLASSSSDTFDKPAKSKPHPENDSASRMAILAKGRRRLASGGPPGLSKSFSGSIRSSSIDMTSSDDVSVNTQETTSTNASKRASRMAKLAAAQRHSPAPTALKKIVDSSKEEGETESNTKQAQGTEYRSRPAMGRSRSSRLVALSSTVNKSSPPQVPQTEATKTDDKEKGSNLDSKERTPSDPTTVRAKTTSVSSSPPLVHSKSSDSSSCKQSKVKPEVESRSSKTPSGPVGAPKRSPATSSSGEHTSPVIPKGSQGQASPGRSAYRPGAARISDHPAMRAKRGSSVASLSPHRSPRSSASVVTKEVLPDRRGGGEIDRRPRVDVLKESFNSAQNGDVTRPEKASSDFSRPYERDAQGSEKTASDISSSHGGVKAAIDAWTSKTAAKSSPQTKEAALSSSYSSPQANRSVHSRETNAWTSKANESRNDRVVKSPRQTTDSVSSPSHSSPQTNRSVQSRETKLSEESNWVSSEVSVGGSQGTYFSSPSSRSSHASSKMSVGAPGSFFRPMDNGLEDLQTDNLLGQLSGTSTDEESTLSSHLFHKSKGEKNRNEDTELSFLLEQMKSESDSEDSGAVLLEPNKRVPRAAKDQEENVDADYGIGTSSEEISSITDHKTASTTLNEPSTLLGQSLLESEGSDSLQCTAVQPALGDHMESPHSTDSRFIKWWQNTDPEKRRQKFESYANPVAKAYGYSLNPQESASQQEDDDDDLFSGLSYDDEDSRRSSVSHGEQKQAGSSVGGGEDVFLGVAAANSSTSQSTNNSAFPPPPPPPPLQTSTSDQFGTILVHGSQAVDSVGSDITSSVLGNDAAKDWARREATTMIKEELTADLEDEEDTTVDGDVLSDRRQKDPSVLSGNSRAAKDPDTEINVDQVYGGEPLDMEDVSVVMSETPKGNSIFMTLGCGMMEPLKAFCGSPADKKVPTSQSLTENDGTESQTLPSTMNEYEQKVWDEWNRQDNEEGSTVGSPTINTVSSEVMERREKAHRQLVQYAEMAKSAVESEESRELPPEEMPTSSLSETTDSDKSTSSDDVPPEESAMTPGSTSTFSVSQQRILEKFSSTLKRSAMEVLKLNRGDKKWQTRYLVVSKEVLWLNATEVNGLSGDRGQCPLGILWTKRFNPSKEYSITSIDRQGRGGVHFDQLVKVSATGRSDLGHPLGKKQQEKFKESVAICVDYTQNGSPKSVVLLCKTTDEAHFLCTGLRVVMDVLKREKSADNF